MPGSCETDVRSATGDDKKTFRKITEEPSFYDDLEHRSVREILSFINREDHRVADAVARSLPQLEEFVERLVERMKRGGRLFYMGAGTSGRLGVLDASEVPPTFGMPPTVVIGIIAGRRPCAAQPRRGCGGRHGAGLERPAITLDNAARHGRRHRCFGYDAIRRGRIACRTGIRMPYGVGVEQSALADSRRSRIRD